MSLDGFSMHALVKELSRALIGGRITTKTLVLELMGKYSNIILVEDGIILDALRKIGTTSSRVRTVLPGDAYELPPMQDKLDLFASPLADILARVLEREKKSPNRQR